MNLGLRGKTSLTSFFTGQQLLLHLHQHPTLEQDFSQFKELAGAHHPGCQHAQAHQQHAPPSTLTNQFYKVSIKV